METLTDANLEAVRQSDQLEGHLMDEMEDRETDITPWGILQRLSPLLFNWVSNQLSLLHRCGHICGMQEGPLLMWARQKGPNWAPLRSEQACDDM